MTPVEFRSVARRRHNLDTNFHSFTSGFNRLVINFDVGHNTDGDKLEKKKQRKKRVKKMC